MKIAFILCLCVMYTCSFTFNRSKTKNDIEHDLKNKKGHKVEEHHHKNASNTFSPKPIKFTSFGKCEKCSKDAKCVPPIQCPAHMKMSSTPQLCDLPGGGSNHGLCCTSGQNHTTKDFFANAKKQPRVGSADILKEIFHDARIKFKTMMHDNVNHHSAVDRGQPDFFHHAMFGNPRPSDTFHVASLSHQAIEHMIASKEFKDKEALSVEESQLNNFNVDLKGSPFENSCPIPPICNLNVPYRTADGTCNHIGEGKGHWGAAKTPMERLLPPSFEDGVWAARNLASDNSPLKSARTISRNVFPDVDRPHPLYNLMVMQFGQFLSHDFTQSASITLEDGGRISCCSKDGSKPLPQNKLHYACMPIIIDRDDQFYSTFNQGCMNFVRLSLAPSHDCRLGYAKTLSKVTHYIDGSVIYGSDLKTQFDLRSFQNGQLRMFVDFDRELLPLHPNPVDCVNPDKAHACFTAGDVRVNQHITLVALHLLFAREHNRVAGVLSELNPHWSDNLLFEEARRIVVAELQHITYNEWLPLIVGNIAMERFSLNTNPHGYSDDYDDDVNPSMTNEFTGAAFRFGHSTVQGKLFVDHENHLNEVIFLPDVFFNPSRLRVRHFYDEILRTLTNEPMQSVDNSVTFGLSRFLFRAGTPFGLDLVSLNIQRGRDEALRPYSDYLDVNGQKVVERFEEFGPVIGPKLSQVYKSPQDIDLFVGGLLESAEDSLVGPTFREIIADQFSRLRKGDRYFYEHNPQDNPGAFTLIQLEEIKRANMARLVCDNADGIALSRQSPAAFILNVPGNEPVACNSEQLPFVNLLAWKENF